MKVFNYFLLATSLCCSAWSSGPMGADRAYILGTDDGISINVTDLPQMDAKTLGIIRIDQEGNIRLPLAGRIHASGLTAAQVEKEVAVRLGNIMNDPEVSVTISEFRSHPVSVLGAVRNPGVYQVVGRKTIYEVLSLAGGLTPDASNKIKITRPKSDGQLPLPYSALDPTHEFYIGELNVRKVMDAQTPEDNIIVLSNDVITVPKADLIYVVGAVHRSGGFPLAEKEDLSVLQAISLAEGLDRTAGAKNARILRQPTPGAERAEIPINVQKILDGREKDVALRANDILFIPTSVAKSASLRALEVAIQVGTGMTVYGRL